MKGISLHIGLNEVDPNHYSGWDGKLNACEMDAFKMAILAENNNFEVSTLQTSNATRNAVISSIKNAANTLKDGDIFLITYSGHGGIVPDINGDDQDGLDETWCLYDGQIIDDELYLLWSEFAEGTRILILSDSCYSGDIARANENTRTEISYRGTPKNTPNDVILNTYYTNKKFYDNILLNAVHKTSAQIKASVKLISGCQETQLSYEDPFGGKFTNAVLKVWNGGKFSGNYSRFHHKVKQQLPEYQTPNLMNIGRANAAFDESRPFAIDLTNHKDNADSKNK